MNPSTLLAMVGLVVAFILLDILIVELRRGAREGARLARRIQAYGEHPLVSLANVSLADIERLSQALEQMTPLVVRAQQALTTLGLIRPKA
jgi:hypothetical protein